MSATTPIEALRRQIQWAVVAAAALSKDGVKNSGYDQRVLIYLATCTHTDTLQSFPSQKKIAEYAEGIDPEAVTDSHIRNVYRSTQRLVDAGFITKQVRGKRSTVDGRRGSNLYTLLIPDGFFEIQGELVPMEGRL